MRGRIAARLAPFLLLGGLAACVPPAPLSVSGTLPPPATTFAIIGDDAVTLAAQSALADTLTARGHRLVRERADRLVTITLADRPRDSGSFSGDASPAAGGWTDTPRKAGWLAKGRREVRLTVRFLSPDGKLLEERVATEVVRRNALPADPARLAKAALR